MNGRSTPTARPVPRRVAALAFALLTLATGRPVLAQAPQIVSTYAYVREADPVVFLRAPDAPSLETIRGVGVRGSERLTVAWFEASDDRLTVSFRLAGDEAAPLDGLVVTHEDGVVDLAIADGVVAPALPSRSERLAVPYEHHAPDSGVAGAGIVANLSPDPMTLRRIDLVPTGAGSGIAAHVHPGPGSREAFLTWIASLTASMEGLAAPLPPATPPETGLPRRLVDLVNEGEAEVVWLDPSAADLELPPGASLFWALTPASFPVDVRGASVTAAPRFAFAGEDGACCEIVPSSGLFEMAWLP